MTAQRERAGWPLVARRRRARRRGARRRGGPILANPTAAAAVDCHADVRPERRRRSRPDRAAPRRRPARSTDRVVVLHRPPARPPTARRFGFEYVIFRAERGAFPTSWVSHLARDRRVRRPVPVRPAPGDRAAGGPVSAESRRDAFGLRPGHRRPRPRRTPGRGAPQLDDGRERRDRSPGCGTRAGRSRGRRLPGGLRPGPAAARDEAAGARTAGMAGSTSGPPAARTTTRGRR